MISPLPCSDNHAVVLAGADISPALRTDHDSDSDRVMDSDEERDYADQGPRSDSDLDGDTQILATLLKLIPGCIDAADIELLLQGIPVQPPVVIPARSMQEAIQAEDMPPLDVDAANVFSKSERIIQEHVRQHDINATVVKDLVQKVIHHRDFNANEVDHDMHQQIEGPSAPSLIVNLTPLCGQ
jgi:hypothetical protein